ncbi:hypothetical protein Ae201684P_015480 [Aphanomyces euteiches]|uniref:DDE Tnp4 domain-containing protein n=1 Tax=Aphanomyces euteiches TaxID=100861 RepID=A0A6G0WQW0_9STRA|nr:hypothetical protein Ae201684_012663 [Aphanomyces euteiches]KAH9095681.1 hypothetical protein Ae201684P_015480 [Aphanomyces euteiches]
MLWSWIRLPQSKVCWRIVEDGFRSKRSIPGIVGAVDGTLIEINRPKDFDGFYNRHGDPSFNVQAIVDHVGKFMSVDIRPGSFSDKKIWKLSYFGRNVRSLIPPGCFIVGDAGYCLFPWLIIPYMPHEEGGKLTAMQRHFNFVLSSSRMVVECAFGRLKERFRILKGVMAEKAIEKSCSVIMACMVLHNILLELNDSLFDASDPRRDSNIYVQPHERTGKTPVESDKIIRQVARHRRNRLAKSIFKSRYASHMY